MKGFLTPAKTVGSKTTKKTLFTKVHLLLVVIVFQSTVSMYDKVDVIDQGPRHNGSPG